MLTHVQRREMQIQKTQAETEMLKVVHNNRGFLGILNFGEHTWMSNFPKLITCVIVLLFCKMCYLYFFYFHYFYSHFNPSLYFHVLACICLPIFYCLSFYCLMSLKNTDDWLIHKVVLSDYIMRSKYPVRTNSGKGCPLWLLYTSCYATLCKKTHMSTLYGCNASYFTFNRLLAKSSTTSVLNWSWFLFRKLWTWKKSSF